MTTSNDTDFVSIERISQSILIVRGHRVLIDAELATLYGVTTKQFNRSNATWHASRQTLHSNYLTTKAVL